MRLILDCFIVPRVLSIAMLYALKLGLTRVDIAVCEGGTPFGIQALYFGPRLG